MKYFVFNGERKGIEYYEFYQGKWDGKTFRKEDSLFLHDDILMDNMEVIDAFFDTIPSFDPFGATEITYEQWREIGKNISQKSKKSKEIYDEANKVLESVFESKKCITVLGI